MKLILIPALILAVLPGPAVRFESDGIRLGDEVVTEKTISLKSVGQLPVLVSGSAIENLSAANKILEVAVADKTLLLEVGIRLERQGESYRLSTHGAPISIDGSAGSISAAEAISFKVTDKGFDFGKEGVLAGKSLTAKVASSNAAVQGAPPPAQDPVVTRRTARSQQTRSDLILRRTFGNGDPTVLGEAAESQSIRMRAHVTPTNLP